MNCLRYLRRMLRTLLVLSITIWFKALFKFFVYCLYIIIIYDSITIRDTLSMNLAQSACCTPLKKMSYYPLPPHNGHLLLSPRWPLWGTVVVERFEEITRNELSRIRVRQYLWNVGPGWQWRRGRAVLLERWTCNSEALSPPPPSLLPHWPP